MDKLTRRTVLPNGVRLLVRELRTAPVVTLNLWVGTGSVDDPEGRAGAAHFIEHLLFGGRGSGGAGGRLVREVLDAGGQLNGETGCDGTNFYQVVPSSAWSDVLRRQVSAVTEAEFAPGDVEAERSVIIEEARGAERHPQSFLWHRLMEHAFPDHPCRRPVLGTEDSLAAMTPRDLVSHFSRHYRGSNLVQVVVGDVDADRVVEEASSLLEGLPSGDRPRRPSLPGTTDTVVRGHGYPGRLDRAYILIGHRVPDALHDDLPALDVLSGLLGMGRSSRLRQRLQLDAGLVSSIDSGVVSLRDGGLHVVRAVTSAESVKAVVEATLAEFRRVARSGVSEEEMEKGVRRLESAYALEHETSDSIARTLGYYETLGDFELAEQYVDRLASVTAVDVRRAAESYLCEGEGTVVSYAPEGTGAPEGAWSPPSAGRTVRPRADRIAEPPAARTRSARFERPMLAAESSAPVCRRRELPNGAVIVECASRAVPVASVAVAFRGGHSEEPRGSGGLTYLTQKALLRGTKRLPAARLAQEIESLGSGMGIAVDRDGFGVGLTVLSSRLERAVALLSEVISEPAFDPAQVRLVREEVLAEIGQSEDDPMHRALVAVLPLVFGEHPYGRSVRGDRTTVTGLASENLAEWHADRYGGARMVVCGAGDLPPGEVAAVAENVSDASPAPEVPPPETRPDGRTVIETPDSRQSTVLVAFKGPAAGTDEAVAARVAARGLGMMGGPLWRRLRERPPHAYSVGANVFQFGRASIVVAHATSQPGSEEKVREALIETFDGLAAGGMDTADLGRARRSAAGAYEIALQRGAARAVACSMAEILGTGYERVFRTADLLRGVTSDCVADVARRYLTAERGAASVIVKGA
ncbi:MAG: hypothetical protein GF405_00930 [Candidatus Eisenbacteria bacterium]|nr:hypothetical protein [Candidatus Eisenbacteria bacterium]